MAGRVTNERKQPTPPPQDLLCLIAFSSLLLLFPSILKFSCSCELWASSSVVEAATAATALEQIEWILLLLLIMSSFVFLLFFLLLLLF